MDYTMRAVDESGSELSFTLDDESDAMEVEMLTPAKNKEKDVITSFVIEEKDIFISNLLKFVKLQGSNDEV